MPDSRQRIFNLKCRICGASFTATSSTVHRCAECEGPYQFVLRLCTLKHRRLKTPHSQTFAVQEAKAVMREAVEKGIPVKDAASLVRDVSDDLVKEVTEWVERNETENVYVAPPPTRRCLYCGSMFTGRAASDYCASCVEAGFHYLHEVTGRTNGWDKPSRKRRSLVFRPY